MQKYYPIGRSQRGFLGVVVVSLAACTLIPWKLSAQRRPLPKDQSQAEQAKFSNASSSRGVDIAGSTLSETRSGPPERNAEQRRPVNAALLQKAGPNELLAFALKAYAQANDELRSMRGTGSLNVSLQRVDENEPGQMTTARVQVDFDAGKYRLRMKFDKRIADWKPNDQYLIFDGNVLYSIAFSDRIHPTGCSGDIYPAEQIGDVSDELAIAGFPFTDAARLWNDVVNLRLLVRTLGKDGIKMTFHPDRYRGTYHMKNAPQVKAEFDVAKNTGLVTAHRIFNSDDDDQPVIVSSCHWEQAKGTWYVEKLTITRDFRHVESNKMLSTSEFKYDTFEVNADIDSALFTLASVPIPVGTRFM